jgi:hypothetical protein
MIRMPKIRKKKKPEPFRCIFCTRSMLSNDQKQKLRKLIFETVKDLILRGYLK